MSPAIEAAIAGVQSANTRAAAAGFNAAEAERVWQAAQKEVDVAFKAVRVAESTLMVVVRGDKEGLR